MKQQEKAIVGPGKPLGSIVSVGLRRYIWSNVSFSRSFSSQRTTQYVLPCQSNRASDGFFDEAHLSACYNTLRLIAFVVYLICRYCCDFCC